MHEGSDLRCLFGCKNKKDDLRHYLICPVLRCEVYATLDASPIWLGYSALERSGILNPSPSKAKALALAFRVYHSLKNVHLRKIRAARAADDLESIRLLVREVARTQWRDM